MRANRVKAFDAAEFLNTEEDIALYLNEVMETEDSKLIMTAFGDVARARSMGEVADKAGMTRQGAYKALSGEGNPSFETLTRIAGALGVQFRVEPKSKKHDEGHEAMPV